MILNIQQALESQLVYTNSEFQGYGKTVKLFNECSVFYRVKECDNYVYFELYPQKITLDEFKMNELLQVITMNFSFETQYLAMGYEDCYLVLYPRKQNNPCPCCGEYVYD